MCVCVCAHTINSQKCGGPKVVFEGSGSRWQEVRVTCTRRPGSFVRCPVNLDGDRCFSTPGSKSNGKNV